jgi:glycerate 2-kinase
VLSDVVGDPPPDIASGPTVADPSSFRDALATVDAWHLRRQLPPGIVRHLEAGRLGRVAETPKPGHPRLRRSPFVVAASNRTALTAAAAEAHRRGYQVLRLSSRMTGETRDVAARFARTLLARRTTGPFALLGGGETTVTLEKGSGRGGRNQEFALAALPILAGRSALVLSIGTDGIDGPTEAAGGWSDGRAADRARALGIDVAAALRRHASYSALDRLGELVRTGPTGTNVMDLHVGLRSERRYAPSRYGRK